MEFKKFTEMVGIKFIQPDPKLSNIHINGFPINNIYGRITNIRKTKFAVFMDMFIGNGELNLLRCIVFNDIPELVGKDSFISVNDCIKVNGHIFINRNKKFLLSIDYVELTAKCQLKGDIGKKKGGIMTSDMKTLDPIKYYLGNLKSRTMLVERFEIISFIRSFFIIKNYIEVDTSILKNIQGGAFAKPFKTIMNDTGHSKFMRIATEIDLKKLIIVGFKKIFEIGHQFRNEGVDATHYPEFSSIEFYEVGKTYIDMISIVKSLIIDLTDSSEKKDIRFIEFDFVPELVKVINIKNEPEIIYNKTKLIKKCNEIGIKIDSKTEITHAKLLDKLFHQLVEPKFSRQKNNYSIVYHHPIIMSPLAKACEDNSKISQRFELYFGDMELANGYTEQNDPDIQLSAFQSQRTDIDPEDMPVDNYYIQCMRYGLPNLAGCGIGIERLLMALNEKDNIKDTLVLL